MAEDNRPNIAELGKNTRFSSWYQPKNRRKNRLPEEAKKNGLSKDELITGIRELMKLDFEQLNTLAKDRTQPAYKMIIANALIGDLQRKNLVNINSVADRVFGTVTQKVESVNKNTDEVKLPQLTEKALLKLAGLEAEINRCV